jgi:N-acetyl sugar amidotransferase
MSIILESPRRIPALPGQIMPGEKDYRMCVRCVMDTTHTEIYFDEPGVCNFCHGYDQIVAGRRPSSQALEAQLQGALARIKADGRGRDYDCLLGLSGGVDSSYLAVKCKDWGLRPLLVQMDNGWNTELANHNIHRICETLGFDLHTHVIDWSEFRDLQLSFLRAGVANFEAPSDHGIFACIYRTAADRGIRWILTGVNQATEACAPLPKPGARTSSYGYRYGDLVHLKAIHRRFGSRPLRTFPSLGYFHREWLERSGRIRRFDPLNYMPYIKQSAVRELQERVGWRPYTGKHFESVVTRFHQCYILPVKFGLDKRKLHLSGLIWSGQGTREEALVELSQPACPPAMLAQDREFFMKKMGLTAAALDQLMVEPAHDFSEYPNIDWLYRATSMFFRKAGQIKRSLKRA